MLACCSHCVWKIADPSHYHPSFLRKSSWFDCNNREHIAAISPRLPALFSSLVVGTPAVLRPHRHSSAPRSCKTTPMTGWCHVLRYACLPPATEPSSELDRSKAAAARPRGPARTAPKRRAPACPRPKCCRAVPPHGTVTGHGGFPGEARRGEGENERDANVVSKIIACEATVA